MSAGKDKHITDTIKEYGRNLLRFIRGKVKSDADAEDILQDVWYQFSAVVNAEPIEQTGAWLYRVARNKIIDRYKKKTEVLTVDSAREEDDDEIPFKELLLTDGTTPESEYMRNLFWDQFFNALNELPDEQRQVFIWHELEGLSFADIAELTGENNSTLISRKRYAVLHLRRRLKNLKTEILNY